MLILEECQR